MAITSITESNEISNAKSFIGHSNIPPYNASRDNFTNNKSTGTTMGKLSMGIIMALLPALDASALMSVKVSEKLKLPRMTTIKK